MSRNPRILITGSGALCAAGKDPAEILQTLSSGRSAISPIRQWDATAWPTRMAGEIVDFDANALLRDRKLLKLIRRTDVFGLYAAGRAIEESDFIAFRDALEPTKAAAFSDRTAVCVGSGGGSYESQYDFFPLLTAAGGSLETFGRELEATINPMWLLRILPNNVLCHIGIKHGLKGANACITNHGASGALAVIEAAEMLRTGEADRTVAVGHDAPIEPQQVLYYNHMGLLASEALLPFDVARSGTLFGEGAGALILESETAAADRGAKVYGEFLGSGFASEAQGLLAIRDDGEGLSAAIELALEDAGVRAGDVGMIVAHGNGTRGSDHSEAVAIRRVFGAVPPPVTAFKWAVGHLLAASGIFEAVLGLAALGAKVVPGVANLHTLDPDCAGLPVSATAQSPRSDIGMVLCRGFGGTNAALVFRA